MPTSTFDFYQRAYAINQAHGTSSSISLSSIKMGGTGRLAYQVTKTFYADAASNVPNYNMIAGPNYYNNNFQYNSAGHTHSASYLQLTNVGKPVPVADSFFQQAWDQTSRPSALGDFYTNTPFVDLRDGSWVETGNDTHNTINVYNINGSSGQIDWISTHTTGCPFTADCANTRLFTHPTFNSDNVGGYGSGISFIAYFAWDYGLSHLYYELFGFDYTSGNLSSITSVTTLAIFDDFSYKGKHDMFFLINGAGGPSLLIWGSGLSSGYPQVYEIDLTGNVTTQSNADAVSYSYALDVMCWGDNSTAKVYTALGSLGNQVDNKGASHCKFFDCDCNDNIEGVFNSRNDTFYFGDDQISGSSAIKGWAVSVDGSGNIVGVNSLLNPTSGISFTTLARVVAIAPLSMVVGGDGIHTTTQVLARISCKSSWYSAVRTTTNCYAYPTTSHHTDFLAMDHSYCHDIYGGYDLSGFYTSGRETGLPVGAGNQHIHSIDSGLNNYFFSNNYVNQYQNQNQTVNGSYTDIQNNLIYLGPANWTNSSGLSYVYLSITSGGAASPFSTPIGGSPGTGASVGGAVNFGSSNGVLLLTFFYG